MSYKGAFECDRCPRSNEEWHADDPEKRSCPVWWEFTVRDAGAKEDRLQKMCGYQALPRFLTEVIAASNRPAAAIESMRDNTIQALIAIANKIPEATAERVGRAIGSPALETGG